MFQQNFSDLIRKLVLNTTYLTSSRQLYQTHYDVLNLERDCTTKQVRNAFIQLSKQYHPDINKNKQSNAKFLKIKEAYNVLSRPDTRRNYDLGLFNPKPPITASTTHKTETPTSDSQESPLFWSSRKHKFDHPRHEPYYGIKGVRKVSNSVILMCCVVIMSVAAGLQALAVNKSVTLKRENIIKRSEEAGQALLKTREIALKNGNDLQIEIMRKRYEENMKVMNEK